MKVEVAEGYKILVGYFEKAKDKNLKKNCFLRTSHKTLLSFTECEEVLFYMNVL